MSSTEDRPTDLQFRLRRDDAQADYAESDSVWDAYLDALASPVLRRDDLLHNGYSEEEADYALQMFQWRGLTEPTGEDTWQVLPPDISIPAYAARLEDHARRIRGSAPRLARLFQKSMDDRARPATSLTQLLGYSELAAAIDAVRVAGSSRQVSFFAKQPHLERVLDRDVQWLSAARGPRPQEVLTVFDLEAVTDAPQLRNVLADRAAQGEHQRVAPGLPFSLVLADTDQAVVYTIDETGQPIGMHLNNAAAGRALHELTSRIIEHSTPLAQDEAASGSAQETQILQLLSIGTTDAAIARSLGISRRTVERRISAYMNQVGASTRFQAGVEAARRGQL